MSNNTQNPEINTRANREPRTNSSLREQLFRQIKYLNNSAALFDQGDHDEAIRLATTLRVLLHDTFERNGRPNSTSLLSLIGEKNRIKFVDTGVYKDLLHEVMKDIYGRDRLIAEKRVVFPPSNAEFGLVELCDYPDGYCGWQAPCVEHRFSPSDRRISAQKGLREFSEWWNDQLIETSQGRFFNRKNLVLIMANQDGGAHVHDKLDKDYNYLCTDNLGMSASRARVEHLVLSTRPPLPARNNVAYASVRQIAYEVCLSLSKHLGTPRPREGRLFEPARPQISSIITGVPVVEKS